MLCYLLFFLFYQSILSVIASHLVFRFFCLQKSKSVMEVNYIPTCASSEYTMDIPTTIILTYHSMCLYNRWTLARLQWWNLAILLHYISFWSKWGTISRP